MTTSTLMSPQSPITPLIKEPPMEPPTQRKRQKHLRFYQGATKPTSQSLNGQYPNEVDWMALYGPNDQWPRTVAEAERRWEGRYTDENAGMILATEPMELRNGWLVWQANKVKPNHWPVDIIEAYERPRGPYTIINIETIISEESIELLNGWLVWQEMTDREERRVVARINDIFSLPARHAGFGEVLPDQTECLMQDGSTLIPDAMLISQQRLDSAARPVGPNDRPIIYGGPELVVEARSPSNTRAKERLKRQQYFSNGTQIVWDVDDRQQKIWVYRASSPETPVEYGIEDEITCELLPRWRRRVADIFSDEVSARTLAGEVADDWIEEGREEGLAIGEERGVRNNILTTLPILSQACFGQPLPSDISQRLQMADLATLQTLQTSVATSPSMDAWLSQLS
ncbi:MAG: Uma2 family endonuclease [Chloroflexota bacterium]